MAVFDRNGMIVLQELAKSFEDKQMVAHRSSAAPATRKQQRGCVLRP